MSDQSTLPPRPDEETLSELVWAHNPDIGSRPKQMTRGKLLLLGPSGYREFVDTPEQSDLPADPAADDAAAGTEPPAVVPVEQSEGSASGSVNRREKGQS